MRLLSKAGIYCVFRHEDHKITVVLTHEFVRRFHERRPDPEATGWLLEEGLKEPLDMFLAMPGTRSIGVVLKATRTKVNVTLEIKRHGSEPPKVTAHATTVHVGDFRPKSMKDYPFTFDRNPPVTVVFEREYETDLVRLVLDDLESRLDEIDDGVGYTFGDGVFKYIAEREGTSILIPDARWTQDVYVYDFTV